MDIQGYFSPFFVVVMSSIKGRLCVGLSEGNFSFWCPFSMGLLWLVEVVGDWSGEEVEADDVDDEMSLSLVKSLSLSSGLAVESGSESLVQSWPLVRPTFISITFSLPSVSSTSTFSPESILVFKSISAFSSSGRKFLTRSSIPDRVGAEICGLVLFCVFLTILSLSSIEQTGSSNGFLGFGGELLSLPLILL